MATTRLLAARRGRPSLDGVQASLAAARDSNTRLLTSNVNLAFELRARRDESAAFAREVMADAEWIAQPDHAEDTFTVVQIAQNLAGLARRHLARATS